jgi:NAD(P)-dependent dehydrogenase (short-subunit alcohol dehydrogenase family)
MQQESGLQNKHVVILGGSSGIGLAVTDELLGEQAIETVARLGEPEDIATVVPFLAGADGGWINSQVIKAKGGFAY